MQEPGRSVTVLAIIKDSLEDGLALPGSHSDQSDHRIAQMGKYRTLRYRGKEKSLLVRFDFFNFNY